MGLDNGIHVKKNDKLYSIDIEFSWEFKQEFEVCYWRKWWGFRDDVVDYLNSKYKNPDAWTWKLDIEDIKQIIEILKNWKAQGEEHWTAYGHSIWYWDEDYIDEKLCRDINMLQSFLEKTKDFFDELEIYFYDSY